MNLIKNKNIYKSTVMLMAVGIIASSSLVGASTIGEFPGNTSSLVPDKAQLTKYASLIKNNYEGSNGLITINTKKLDELKKDNPIVDLKTKKTKLQKDYETLESTFNLKLSNSGKLTAITKKANVCSGVTATSSGILDYKQKELTAQQSYVQWSIDYLYYLKLQNLQKARYKTDTALLTQKSTLHATYEARLANQAKKAKQFNLEKRMNSYSTEYRLAILSLDKQESASFDKQRAESDIALIKDYNDSKAKTTSYYLARNKSITDLISLCKTTKDPIKIAAKFSEISKAKTSLAATYQKDIDLVHSTLQKSVIVSTNTQVGVRTVAEKNFADTSKLLKTKKYIDVFSKVIEKN